MGIALFGIGLVGLLDYYSGSELRVYPLYYLPLSFGAWRLRRWGAVTLSIACAIAWMAANQVAGMQVTHPGIWAFNVVLKAAAASTVALLMVSLRERLQIETLLGRTDPLTGLGNRQAFHERAGLVLSLANRHGWRVTLAFLDLDDFKAVNDQRGHEEGDQLLRAVADVLTRSMRTSDIAARLGGDEFVLFFPDTGIDEARVLLGRLRSLLAEAMRSRSWPVSASIGAACFSRAPTSLEAALQQADAIMYGAKRSGRNRLVLENVESG